MRTFKGVIAAAALVLLTYAAYRAGWLGGVKVSGASFRAPAGEALSGVGKKRGFLFEWEVEGPGAKEVIEALAADRPAWVLSPEEAAAERTIEALTDEVLGDLPEPYAKAAKERSAPVFRVKGAASLKRGELSLEFTVSAEYGGRELSRKGGARVEWRAHGVYPPSRTLERAASVLAAVLKEGFTELIERDGEVSLDR